MNAIKSMKLYTHVDRIENELAALGKAPGDSLSVDELSAFDQLHYHGTDALDHALEQLAATAGQRWLEVGSGIGGPARYLAWRGGLEITALELQSDQHEQARSLTRRVGLEPAIDHVCGDFLEHDFADARFDAVVSWLALYHIPERARLLGRCHQLLRAGGRFYAEDLFARGNIDDDQLADLERDLYAITLPDFDAYQGDLERAGFVVETIDDMTDDWADFTQTRLAEFRAAAERHRRVHGDDTVQALDDFYSAVDYHFQSGKLGGIRVCARRVEEGRE